MKKNLMTYFTRIISIVFLVSTAISFFIAYRGIRNKFAAKFLMAYLFFAFFYILYMLLVAVINLKKLKWIEVKKRTLRLMLLFALFSILDCIFYYIFGITNRSLLSGIWMSLALAFGMSFMDIVFKKNNT
ncbi:hypothetical protein [Clostridium autoethanogenum]|nr:hypothetical protein [Clostridium autoethanogenum]ALU35779.1 Hypothetical protein CLAU_1350 [Clostridium autoethanogenum DSM 10061]OVY52159.1 hypothetical protein WX72_01051 [Clostridium autoethanogenum]